jgi:hypothetical protein
LPWQALAALVLAVLAAGRGLYALFRIEGEAGAGASLALQRAAIAHLLLIYILTVAVAAGYSLAFAPVLMPRYLIALLGIQLLLIARGIASLRSGTLMFGIVDADKTPLHVSGEHLTYELGWQRTWGPEQVALPMSWVRLELSRWSFTGAQQRP